IFLMGDLSYPGGFAHRTHHQMGERVASVGDVLVTQGNLAAIAGRAALDYGMIPNQVRMTYSHQDAAAVLRDHLGANDVVLVKGSRMAGMEAVVRELLQQDEDARLLTRQGEVWDRGWAVRSLRASWVEVDLDATAQNVRQLCDLVGPDVALMAMVPADAYGHGAVAIGSTAMLNGAAYLGVGSLDEAIALRNAGIDAPILIKGYVSPWALRDALHHDLTVAIYDLEMARLGNRLAGEMRRQLRVHVNIDTGMRRLGLLPEQVMDFFRALKLLDNLDVEGIFTELAAAGEDDAYTREQLAVFSEVLMPLLASEMRFRYIHAADTTALLMIPASYFSMVRAGSALYGLAPEATIGLPQGFKPILAWKTVIAQVKTLPRSGYVGGGKQYWGEAGQRVAVIPVGYADGLSGNPSPWREVLVHGQRVPIVGHVGMHEATIALSNAPDARVGDEVVVIGRQGESVISVEEVATWLHASIHQVLSLILARTTRL
ncbi:MAG: alanine racemase, partial [Anaerolineae bacterium]|nr:alanine racemase [Anaerolineae bacterium]